MITAGWLGVCSIAPYIGGGHVGGWVCITEALPVGLMWSDVFVVGCLSLILVSLDDRIVD